MWGLLTAKREVDQAKAAGLREVPPDKIGQIEAEYTRLMEQGYQANPKQANPKVEADNVEPTLDLAGKRRGVKQTSDYNLLRRLEQRDQVMAFLYDFDVPFDNNQAERDVRMMKVKQKVSGCFRTLASAHTFNGIRSYLSTMHK